MSLGCVQPLVASESIPNRALEAHLRLESPSACLSRPGQSDDLSDPGDERMNHGYTLLVCAGGCHPPPMSWKPAPPRCCCPGLTAALARPPKSLETLKLSLATH